MEEDDSNDDDQESQTETKDKDIYFMGTQSQPRKRFGRNNSVYWSRPNFRKHSTGDKHNLLITHQIVIDQDQTQECTITQEHNQHNNLHSDMHPKTHTLSPDELDADALIEHK